MLQLHPVYLLCNRRKTLKGSPDPMRANSMNKPCSYPTRGSTWQNTCHRVKWRSKLSKAMVSAFSVLLPKYLKLIIKLPYLFRRRRKKIMKFLCENFDKYTAYHQQKSELTAGDTLISDVIELFSSRNYNTNIMDLLMQITTD